MIFAFVHQNRANFKLEIMLRVFNASKSGHGSGLILEF